MHYQRLHAALRWQAKLLRYVCNCLCAGRGQLLHRLAWRGVRQRGRRRGLHVGGVVAGRAVGETILAALGQHMELVGFAVSHGARIRFHRSVVQADAIQNGGVAGVHGGIGFVQRCFAEMKRVAVLHDELAGAHQAEAGPNLVPELGLDVVEVAGQLLVAGDHAAEQLGNHFLLRWAQAVVPGVAILEAQQLRPHHVPATALLPEFRRLHHRHEDFLGAGASELLAHDALQPRQHANAKRQPVITAGGQAADESGAREQHVARHLGVRRRFSQRGDEQFAELHALASSRTGVNGTALRHPLAERKRSAAETDAEANRGVRPLARAQTV